MDAIWLTREQLQALMMRLHNVIPERRIALMGRLKHLQRLGWPPDSNLGKGKRVRYSAQQIVLVALALEMIQLGLTPERTVKTLQAHFAYIWPVVSGVAGARGKMSKPSLLILDPAALSNALDSIEGDGEAVPDRAPGDSDLLEHWTKTERRASVISMNILLKDTDRLLVELEFVKPGAFFNSLQGHRLADSFAQGVRP